MDHNFGGAGNQRPRFSGSVGQNFQGMSGFPGPGFQGQQYQPGMNPRFQHAEGGFGQHGNMVRPQFQQQYPQQQFNQQQQQFHHHQQQQFHQHQQQQQQQFHQHQQQFNPQQHQQQQQNFQQNFQQKQYQKMMEQQQKLAQENHKKELEMRKKREFEMQQKRLQQMSGGMKKSGGADLSHLIGNLAQRSADKPVTPKGKVGTATGRSFFARPGTSYPPPPEPAQQKDHSLPPDSGGQQQGVGGISGDVPGSGGPTLTTGPGISIANAVAGGSTSGPGFGIQTNDDDGFSDFQEAKPSFPNQNPSSTGWSVQTGNPPQPQVPVGHTTFQGNPGIPANQQFGRNVGAVYPNQHLSGDQQSQQFHANQQGSASQVPGNQSQQFHGNQQGSASQVPGNQNQQFHGSQQAPGHQLPGNHMFNSNQVPGNQDGNLSFPGSQHFQSQPGNNIPSSTWGNQSSAMTPGTFTQSSTGPNQFSSNFQSFNVGTMGPSLTPSQRERAESQSSVSSASSTGMTSERPIRLSGQFAPVDGQPGNMQAIDQQGSPGQTAAVGEDDQNTEVKEETEDEKLERLYGIKIPDWCKNGHNLPGVYKDVKDTVTKNGGIDTGSLYPILLASELSRDILGQIWNRVNKATPGQLTDMELRMILGLVALGQTGLKVERLTLEKLSSCKTAPIPSLPETLFKPSEGWSFQNQDNQAPTTETLTNSDPSPKSNSPYTGWSFTAGSSTSSTTSQGSLMPGQNILPSSVHSHTHSDLMPGAFAMTSAANSNMQGQTLLASHSSQSNGLFSGQNATPSSMQGGLVAHSQSAVASSASSNMGMPGLLGIMTTSSSSQMNTIPGPAIPGGHMVVSSSGSASFGTSFLGQKTPPATSHSIGHGSAVTGFNTGLTGLSGQEGMSTSSEFQGFQSAGVDEDDDFGDFHSSTSSLDTGGTTAKNMKAETVTTINLTTSLDSFKLKSELAKTSDLAASLESFKLKSSSATSLESFKLKTEQSLFTSIKPPPQQPSPQSTNPRLSNSLNDINAGNKATGDDNDTGFATFPALSKPPNFGGQASGSNGSNNESQAEAKDKYDFFQSSSINNTNQNNTTGGMSIIDNSASQSKPGDKYDFLRGLDSSESNEFSTDPPTSRKKDDSFGDFEGFERAEANANDGFGDFQANTNSSGFTFPSNPPTENTNSSDKDNWNAFGSVSGTQNESNFGDFKFGSTSQSVTEDDFGDFSQPTQTIPNSSSNFGNFFSGTPNANGTGVEEGRQRSGSSLATFASAVPLDSLQKYKQLCGEEEEADQHGHVWGRCLNSCLLTMATCAVAVQSMSDPGIKQEILHSKKGQDYFKAIIEVHRVTQRIEVSLIKTDFFSQKLKDILGEINQTWRNISNFLTGTDLESNLHKDDFTGCHIQADEDKRLSCGLCLLNVTKASESKISYGGREYHAACANFWCNRVDSILPSLWPVNSLI